MSEVIRRPFLLSLIVPAIMVFCSFSESAGQSCDAPDAPAWVTRTRNYVMKYDRLAGYAVERYGAPVSCEGSVTTEFDGESFGLVRLQFKGGATFEMETQPPEASIATLADSSGFGEEATLRDVLKQYAEEIGLEIDWSDTTSTADRIDRSETYWAPDDGMNASAQLVFRRDTLISVKVSLAL